MYFQISERAMMTSSVGHNRCGDTALFTLFPIFPIISHDTLFPTMPVPQQPLRLQTLAHRAHWSHKGFVMNLSPPFTLSWLLSFEL